MGQTSSRYQQRSNEDAPSNPPFPAVVASTSSAEPESPSDTTTESPNPPRSRRTSIRKNIINLVKPSSSRNRTASQSSTSGDYRRSWRNTRRWSKAPPESTCPVIVEPSSASSSDTSIAGPSNIHAIPLDKGKQREVHSSAEEDEQDNDNKVQGVSDNTLLSTVPGSPEAESDKASSNAESSHTALDAPYSEPPPDGDSALPHWNVPDAEPELTSHDQPIPAPVIVEPTTSEPISPPQEQSSTQPGTRPFPPPGTLVVVQGIVHTTDVANPRPGDSSGTATSPTDTTTPQPNLTSPVSPRSDGTPEHSTSRVRNRLSTLLRSRSSAHGSGQVSASNSMSRIGTPEPNTSAAASPAASTAPSRTQSTAPTVDESPRTTQDPTAIAAQPPSTTDAPSSSISSSSIDVLGTLLSVAAAATAASLLTGSSEPILSSGLAPTGTNASPQIPSTSPSSPGIPSMSNLPPYSGGLPAESGLPDISAAGRAERMREAWGAIRQRLGLRPSAGGPATPDAIPTSPLQSPTSEAAPASPGLGSLTDTRELMLAEMARAFNIGLGLNGLGGLNSSTPASPPAPAPVQPILTSTSSESLLDSDDEGDDIIRHVTAAAHLPMPSPPVPVAPGPPEGSFERFLVDLQVDLRLALTQGPATRAAATALSRIPMPMLSTLEPTTNGDQARADTPRPTEGDDNDHDSMPDLQDVVDSDSEADEDDEYQSAAGHPEATIPPVGFPAPGTSRMDASGRINWWRLYRFPPIPPPRADGLRHTAAGVPAAPAQPAATAPVPNPEPVAPADPALPNQTSDAPQTQGSAAPAPPPFSTVVPVIVVGLQSVDTDWRHEDGDAFDDEGDLFGAPRPTGQVPAGTEAPAAEGTDASAPQRPPEATNAEPATNNAPRDGSRPGRTRGWHTRAANALRNLRPGRRAADAGTGATATPFLPGSRTFLIYVIGGYYPPDHSIVTGGPNVLDSFEALLELADLLGQVKPPTATKDDVEKSGLEIIKASEVPQHEKDGKISSNCTDRCLICLDDYEPEDQVRVMSCRHAFHKGCVDEWLVNGRNNCPACRSTGVNTDGGPTLTPSH